MDAAKKPIAYEAKANLLGYRVRRAVKYINDNLDENLELADIANAARTSPYHFARLFKRAIGIAPHQYVIKQRAERAKQLLAEAELPLVEIGLRVGFNTQSHFSTLFRRRTGVTPKQYQAASRRYYRSTSR